MILSKLCFSSSDGFGAFFGIWAFFPVDRSIASRYRLVAKIEGTELAGVLLRALRF